MRWATMLRGVNLGKRQISKGDLLAAAADLGFSDARTLLASGNLDFDAGDTPPERIETSLGAAVKGRTGIDAEVFARDAAALDRVIAANLFPDAAADRPSRLLVVFCDAAVPTAALDTLRENYDGPERVAAVGRELFIDYVEGVGRSRLDPAIAKLRLPLPRGTARNWNTVLKLRARLG